jgi:hypothetical protein
MKPTVPPPPAETTATLDDPEEKIDRARARWEIAASSVAGVSAGIFVGVIVGMKLHSGATRVHHRIASVHDAWDMLRD